MMDYASNPALQRVSMLASACVVASLGWSVPAFAQDSEAAALDQLVERSSSASSAVELSREQAAGGDLLGAAATLERALIADENADDARLAYAALLCRLDDRQSSELELQALNAGGGNQAARDEVEKACGIAPARARRKSGLAGEIGVGLAYESDALGALQTFPTFFMVQSDDGLGAIANASISGRFGEGSNYFYLDAWGQAKEELSGPQEDYQIGSLSLGYATSWSNKDLKLGGVIRHGRIFGAENFTEYGAEIELTSASSAGSRATVRAEAVWQHDPLSFGNGMHYDLAAYYDWRRSDRLVWFFGGGAEIKDADSTVDKYVAGRLMAGLDLLLDSRGTYAKMSSTVRYVVFGEKQFTPLRRDLRVFTRAAIGTPLGRSGLNIEAAVSHSYRDYSQSSQLADYSSFGGSLSLIWKFGNRR
jgi:hypothetical protein